jgi:hypothetical protein
VAGAIGVNEDAVGSEAPGPGPIVMSLKCTG